MMTIAWNMLNEAIIHTNFCETAIEPRDKNNGQTATDKMKLPFHAKKSRILCPKMDVGEIVSILRKR